MKIVSETTYTYTNVAGMKMRYFEAKIGNEAADAKPFNIVDIDSPGAEDRMRNACLNLAHSA